MEDEGGHHAPQQTDISPPARDEKGPEAGAENGFDQQTPGSAKLSRFWWVILCSSMLLAEMQVALDTTITADLQPAIINALGEVSKLPWINVTYSLANGATCLLWGKLLVFFDSKVILFVSRLLFVIGSALTAAAPSMDAFIVGKAITGMGGSGTYISIITIFTALTAAEERGRCFGYIGFMWGLGTIIGPVIGGAFAVSAAGWRWSFYFNLILAGVFLPVFLFVLPSTKTSTSHVSFWTRARRIDFVGSLLFAGALCSGIMAMLFGGALYTWGNGRIIGLLCCSGVLWIFFSIQQATATFTTTEDRIVPIDILRSWEMWVLIIQTGCAISMLFITIYYIPLYFQFVRGESAIRSAVDLLPFLFTSVFAMLISGRLMTILSYYKPWFITGSSLALIMSVCLYTTEVDSSHGKIYGYLILGGVGTGVYAMNAGSVMLAIVAKENMVAASTIFGCVDIISSVFSVGVANSVFVNRASNSIQRILPSTPRTIVQEAITGVGASLADRLPPLVKAAVLQAILNAIKDAWIQMIATAALSFVLSCFLRNQKLSH